MCTHRETMLAIAMNKMIDRVMNSKPLGTIQPYVAERVAKVKQSKRGKR